MKYTAFLITVGCLFMGIFSSEAVASDCPKGGKSPQELSTLIQSDGFLQRMKSQTSKIQACLDAKNPASITEYYCPPNAEDGKKVFFETARPINEDTLPYVIMTDLLLTEIDRDVEPYFQSLQCNREKDPAKWIIDIRNTIEGQGTAPGFATIYTSVCDFGYIEKVLKDTDFQIKTTDTYPQELCKRVVEKKIQAYKNLGYMLMKQGIEKSYQNDKDTMIDQVKGGYARVLMKFNSYLVAINRAIQKIDAYIKNPNKGG